MPHDDFDELAAFAQFAFSSYDKTTWSCDVCRDIGQDKVRGCGVTQKEPVLIIPETGRRLYTCPVAASIGTRLLFGYLAGVSNGMIAPPARPTIAWLRACQVYGEAAAMGMSSRSSPPPSSPTSSGSPPSGAASWPTR